MKNHPLFSDTITLYAKSGDKYTRHVLTGVQIRQKIERFLHDGINARGISQLQTVTTVTIPADVSGAGKINPAAGDVIVPGTGPELTPEYPVSKLRADFPGYCTVRAVSDHTRRPRLKHWKVYAT